ncbi:BT_2262 family domain-containing protein [Bacteroides sp.]|uniref:BT_2262 family domain-containing protein n=1 Tax=Bacteroides sp. TaxID=29523 RepID=UPI003AB6388D
MKSKLLYMMMFALAVFTLTGCDDSTSGMTRITYYPELTLDGATTIYLDKGEAFVEPGYSAVMNGEDVTDDVKVTSTVDTSKSGIYTVSYSIVNADGFSSTSSRKVIVMDPSDPVEGFYDTDPNCYRDYNGQTPYGASYELMVISNNDGTYTVEDLLGGWYYYRANYGPNYALSGVITVAADGTVKLVSSYLIGWGDSANYMADGKFDAGTLSWCLNYTDYPMDFYVTMYKK